MFLQTLQHNCLTSASETTQHDPKTRRRGAQDRNFTVQKRRERHTGRNFLQPALMWIWRSEGGVAIQFPKDESKVKANIFLPICQFCTSIALHETEAKNRRKHSAQIIHFLNAGFVLLCHFAQWFSSSKSHV